MPKEWFCRRGKPVGMFYDGILEPWYLLNVQINRKFAIPIRGSIYARQTQHCKTTF